MHESNDGTVMLSAASTANKSLRGKCNESTAVPSFLGATRSAPIKLCSGPFLFLPSCLMTNQKSEE